MDGEALRLLGEVIGGLMLLVFGGAKAYEAHKGRRKALPPSDSGEGKADESMVPKSAVQLEGRLVRMEGKLDTIITGQGQHSADDERRFAALGKELQDTRHDLKDRIAPLPLVSARVDRLEEDLRTTRRQLSLDSSVHDVRGR